MCAEEFYRLRDDRTNSCVGKFGYQSVRCFVTVDLQLLGTLQGQVMVVATCNLLSRWCRTVELVLPRASVHVDSRLGAGGLGEIILKQMRDADPFGAFSIVEGLSSDDALRIHIGPCSSHTDEEGVVINASGWCASIGVPFADLLERHDNENVIGAVGAACLGVAQVFKQAVGTPKNLLTGGGIFDLFRLRKLLAGDALDLGPETGRIDIGRVLMVGAGSVGSATTYCMNLAGVSCDLTVVDGDAVKIENLNRSPVFGKGNFGANKAEAVAQSIIGSRISAKAFPGWWSEFAAKTTPLANRYDVWLPLANEHGVRWSMQNNIPPILIHATTGKNWGVNHGRHIYGLDDCLADRFPEEVATESLTCSTGEVSTPDGQVDAALPFVSLFAGLQVTAELTRLQMPGYPQLANFGLVDFGGPMDVIQLFNKGPRAGCVCTSVSPEVYLGLHGRSRYSHLAFVK